MYRLLRAYVTLALHLYYRRITIHGQENIPAGPVIFAANHQNAFMDALLIVCFNQRPTHFLARADIFNNSLTRRLLSFLRIIPVYRIRDGRHQLSENEKTFKACVTWFGKGESVVIFPEGNHGNQRRLRPLSKGFTRLVSQALQEKIQVSIVPVGLNYENTRSFRSNVSIYFGEPLAPASNELTHSDATALTRTLSENLKKIITHIPDESNYDQVLNSLVMGKADFTNPIETNQRIAEIIHGASPTVLSTKTRSGVLNLPAIILHFIPLLFWWILQRRIRDGVFTSSLRFATGISVFALYYLFAAILVFHFYGVWPALASVLVGIASLMIWKP